jgi:zinc protease
MDSVQKFYSSYLSPSVSELVIVGDITKEAILAKLDFLKNWAPKDVKMPNVVTQPSADKTRIYLVDKSRHRNPRSG